MKDNKSISIPFNQNNTITENKTNKRLLLNVKHFWTNYYLRFFPLLESVYQRSSLDYLSFQLMFTLTALYLYLYYLEARHFWQSGFKRRCLTLFHHDTLYLLNFNFFFSFLLHDSLQITFFIPIFLFFFFTLYISFMIIFFFTFTCL